MGDQIVVVVPKQRNTEEEKKGLKEGRIPMSGKLSLQNYGKMAVMRAKA